jgi:hypothetical protein
MNYLKVYCNLIRKAEERGYTKKKAKEQGLYVEGHHTFPKSIFGKNNRIVYLTAREHYIAHVLLEKIFIKRYGESDSRAIKMSYAHICMKGDGKNTRRSYINSYLYENVKIRVSNNISGENNPMYGIKHDEETRKKMSENGKGKKMPPRTPEHREMLSERMKNREISDETLLKMSESKKGTKPWNKGLKGKQKAWNRGISKPKSSRKHDFKLISPQNEIYITNNLSYFCRVFNKFKLNASSLTRVAKHKFLTYKGWKIELIEKQLDDSTNIYYNTNRY